MIYILIGIIGFSLFAWFLIWWATDDLKRMEDEIKKKFKRE